MTQLPGSAGDVLKVIQDHQKYNRVELCFSHLADTDLFSQPKAGGQQGDAPQHWDLRELVGTTEHYRRLLDDSASQFGSFEDINELLTWRVYIYRQSLGNTFPLRHCIGEEGRFSDPTA